MKVEREIEIDASPETVYETVMDARKLEDWVTIHVELKEAPEGDLKKGSELVQVLRLAHQNFTVSWKVVEAERPRRVVWEGSGPVRSKAKVIYDIAANGDGTLFGYTNEYKLPLGPLGTVAGAAVKRASVKETDRSIAKLKDLLEKR